MALCPSLVSRSVQILNESAKTYTVSTVFIARFNDGSEKSLHRIDKINKDLVNLCEVGKDNVKVLSFYDSPLYFLDWSTVKSYKNNFEKEYPERVLPDFVCEYMAMD
jgi:hypothetical protein